MFNLHKYYLSIKDLKGFINYKIFINYINNLESAQLMYVLNYHLRELTKCDIKNKMCIDKPAENEMEL